MWKLESRSPEGGGRFVCGGAELLVSRVPGAWLQLSGDASVSRKHASLHLVHEIADVKRGKPSTLLLADENAKNGTYVRHAAARAGDANAPVVNESHRMAPGSRVQLQHGDVVRFGLYASYRIVFSPLVVATSMLPNNEAVMRDLLLLGASFSKDWNSKCTHLVMDTIKLSAKVACALASGGHIVTPAYLGQLLHAVREKAPVLPQPLDYLPAITEPSIQPSPSLFTPNSARKTVFDGKTFYFGTEKGHRRLSSIIRLAGGDCGVLKADHVELICTGSALLLKTVEDTASPSPVFTTALKALKNAGLHVIPESDIVLAVLYCSTERFCNPNVSQQLLLDRLAPHTQTQSSMAVFAAETQDIPSAASANQFPGPGKTSAIPSSRTKVIPETPSSSCNSKKSDPATDSAPPPNQHKDKGISPTEKSASNHCDETSASNLPDVEKPTPSLNVSVLAVHEPASASTENTDRASKKRHRSRESIITEPAAKRQAAPKPRLPDMQGLDVPQNGVDAMEECSLNLSTTFAPPLASTQIYEEQGQQNGGAEPMEDVKPKLQAPPTTSDQKTNIPTRKSVNIPKKTSATAAITCVPPTPTPPSQASRTNDRNACLSTSDRNDVVHGKTPVNEHSKTDLEVPPSLEALQSDETETLGRTTQYCPELQTAPLPSLEPPSLDDFLNLRSSAKDSGLPSFAAVNASTPLNPTLAGKDLPPKTADGFQLPSASVRRRKVQQEQQPPESASSSEMTSALRGMKRTLSTVELEEQNKREKLAPVTPAAEAAARPIKQEYCEPSSVDQINLDSTTALPSSSDGFLSGKRQRAQKSPNKTGYQNDGKVSSSAAPDPVHVNSVVVQNGEDVKPPSDELEKNITVCRTLMVSLVLRTSILGDDYRPPETNRAADGPNFKRFRKVRHYGSAAALPRIIGGRDLVPHTSVTPGGARSLWLSQHPEVTSIIEQEDREREEDAEQDAIDSTPSGSRSNHSSFRSGPASRHGSISNYFASANTNKLNGAGATQASTGRTRATFGQDAFSQYQRPVANVKRRAPRSRV